MCIPSLVKYHWYLFKLSPGNENIDVRRADEICPINNPKLLTRDLHVYAKFKKKIHKNLIVLESENKALTDG